MSGEPEAADRIVTDHPKGLIDHLEELRRRLLRTALVWVVCSVAAYGFSVRIIAFLAEYTGGFVFLGPADAFLARLKLAVMVGSFLAVPEAIYEAWSFVEVALRREERRVLARVLPVSYMLFACGAAFAWFLVIPTASKVLLGFASEGLRPMISIDSYISFVAWMTLGMGLTFQLPVVVVVLVWLGIVEPRTLSAYRREVIVGIVVFCAMITPGPDIFSQFALAAPTYILYEASVWIAWAWKGPG